MPERGSFRLVFEWIGPYSFVDSLFCYCSFGILIAKHRQPAAVKRALHQTIY